MIKPIIISDGILDNQGLRSAASEKNGNYFLTEAGVEYEFGSGSYDAALKNKVVYIPCHKDGTNVVNNALFNHGRTLVEEGKIRELITSHYNGNVCIIRTYSLNAFGNALETTENLLIPNDEERIASVAYILPFVDVIIANPRGSVFQKVFKMIVAWGGQYVLWGNNMKITSGNMFANYFNGQVKFGNTYNNVIPHTYMNNEWDCENKNATTVYTNINGNFNRKYTVPSARLSKLVNMNRVNKLDNFEALNVPTIDDIPCDYDGLMAVPLTVLGKLDPESYTLHGAINSWRENKNNGLLCGNRMITIGRNGKKTVTGGPVLKGDALFFRVLISMNF